MKDRMSSLKVTQQRNFSAHHALLRIARAAIKKDTRNGSDDQFLAITLSAFAIEPLCNAVGERTVADWPDFERAPPIAKVRTI